MLDELREGEATPDIFRVNLYLRSERHLDENGGRYIEAVRIEPVPWPPPGGTAARGVGALPIAARDHQGASRLYRSHRVRVARRGVAQCAGVRARGCDVCAVTIWSMFGAIDWRSLLLRRDGAYEPAVRRGLHAPSSNATGGVSRIARARGTDSRHRLSPDRLLGSAGARLPQHGQNERGMSVWSIMQSTWQ